VDHPKSMKHLAWTRTYQRSRVFCCQSGHGPAAWEDVNFREVLRRGIFWSAGRS
jgi:type 1 glutamine amidotransferase